MAETAQLAAQAEEYLSRQGALLVEKYGQKRENGMLLSEEFWQKEPVVSSYGVLGVFEQLAGRRKDFTAVHIKSTAGLLALQVGRQISLPYGLKASAPTAAFSLERWKAGSWKHRKCRSF